MAYRSDLLDAKLCCGFLVILEHRSLFPLLCFEQRMIMSIIQREIKIEPDKLYQLLIVIVSHLSFLG